TPLWAAVSGNHSEVVTLLVAKKEPTGVNWSDCCGQTAIHVSARLGNTKITNALIARGADLSGQDHQGMTPLMLAAMKGRRNVVGMLLGAGSNVSATDRNGYTALHWA
ncbi:ankyrin repeat protein, partial [Baffinella frigidus]